MNLPENDIKPLSAEDSKLLSQLIEANEKSIRVTIYNTLGSVYSYLADEAVGELLLLACEKIDTIKTHCSPKAWLLVAARHVAQSVMKKHKKDLLVVEYNAIEKQASNDNVFEDALFAIWIENKVPQKLLALLTKREREVYYKLYIEKKTPKQAAEELGVKRNLINNVNKNLKDKIKDALKQNKF